jgi:serine/threonine protein kinase
MLNEPVIGHDLDPSYRIEAEVNASWLAFTYRARRVGYGSVVAVKHARARLDREALRSVEAEASAWDALRHPNVNSCVERGVHEGRPWIASRWLRGETLATRIAAGPLPLSAAVSVLRPLLAAVASAHTAGLAHRNLKPSNLFFEAPASHGRERVQLLDPMPAAIFAGAGAPSPRTPYLAPELMAGQPGNARGDVFAAGMLALAMLNGAASDADASVETARSIAGASGALMAWIRGATASDPAQRFCDAGEMLAELIACMPRELRSGKTASDSPKRLFQTTARVSSERPASVQRMAAAPPATAATAPVVSLPPPQRIPVEARVDSELERPAAPEPRRSPAPSVGDESGHSLRPIEAPASTPHVAPWSRVWIAVGVVAVIVIAGVTFVQSAPRARVSGDRALQPTAAPPLAPAHLERPPAAAPPLAAVTLAAAPERRPIHDPWSDPTPPELERLHESAKRGALADEAKVTALLDYNRSHRDDARGYLVIGQLYLNRHWRTDCVEQWTTALQRDPKLRGAPEVLPGLLEIIEQGKAAPAAQALVLQAYGAEAADAIQDARDNARSEGGVSRLHHLYLTIADAAQSAAHAAGSR